MKLNKNILLINICSASFVFSFLMQSFIPLIFIFLICINDLKKRLLPIVIFFLIGSTLILTDFLNFKNFIIFSFIVIVLSSKFGRDIFDVLKYNSYWLLFLIIIMILICTPKYGSYLDIISFQQRLWLVFDNGKEYNPNPLGFLCALVSIGFIVNKKYIVSIIPLYLLFLTQSRGSIFFLILFLFFQTKFSLKSISFLLLFFIVISYLSFITGFYKRFFEDGENGRLDRILVYKNLIEESFPFGIPISSYDYISNIYGTLDNMYFLSWIYYGVWSFFIFIFFIFMLFKSRLDDYIRLRLSIFLALFLYGFIESGIMLNYLSWFVLSMCFNYKIERLKSN